MRILFCNYEYPPLGGGGGVVMAAMARVLATRHEVTVLTSRAAGLPHQSLDGAVNVVRVPVFFRRQLAVANVPSMLAYLPSGLWRGLQLGRERRFDVINTHFAVPSGPLGDWLSRSLRIPNVLSVHGGDLFDPSKKSSPHRHALLRAAVARLLRRADVLVAQSQDTQRNVAEIYGVARAVERVPLGIDRPPKDERAERGEFDLPADAFVLVTAGRIVTRKASTQLIDTLVAVPGSVLLVVGDGPEAGALRQRAAECAVADRIRMLGYVSDGAKYRAFRVADLFVSTSQHEGFGLVFLEAMACGLPIVCYDRGGQTDFLATPATGDVVPLNDLTAFNAAVRALGADPERRARIRRNNLAQVESFFIDRCAERYERLFERAVLAQQQAAMHLERR
ncbi:MAG TPA: glycosyltransferase family 4 protein [Steroidobacteraceae bacterium]|nr:glycosyltransferase family 4 protein [Steroidobacteraceae bacterium]